MEGFDIVDVFVLTICCFCLVEVDFDELVGYGLVDLVLVDVFICVVWVGLVIVVLGLMNLGKIMFLWVLCLLGIWFDEVIVMVEIDFELGFYWVGCFEFVLVK